MYKIYINEIPLILIDRDLLSYKDQEDPNILVGKYTGKIKHLLQYIDLCEKGSPDLKKVVIFSDNFKTLKKDFLSLFVINEAAGGLIQNEKNEFLFIYRRGFWDMPKGKLEKGETKKQTAIREVNEETGIKNITIIKKLGVTKHVFKNKVGIRIIKKSYWYLMKSPKQTLKPQATEDIEEAVWMTMNDFLSSKTPIYKNILDILDIYEKQLALSNGL